MPSLDPGLDPGFAGPGTVEGAFFLLALAFVRSAFLLDCLAGAGAGPGAVLFSPVTSESFFSSVPAGLGGGGSEGTSGALSFVSARAKQGWVEGKWDL